MREKNLTMKDIAKLAGVSQPTVSRVINKSSKVSKDIEERVKDIIAKYNFKANESAKILRGNKSKTIGLIVYNFSNYYYLEMVKYVEKEIRKKGYTLIVMNSENSKEIELDHIKKLLSKNVEGILIAPICIKNLKFLKNKELPFLVINRIIEGYSYVSTSLYKGGRIATEYMVKNGYKDICFIGSVDDNPKFLGYMDVLKENHLKISNDLILDLKLKKKNTQLIEEFLKNKNLKEIAYVTADDEIAYIFSNILLKKNLLIGKDISIIGFDNTIIAKVLNISSVEQPMEKMIKVAVDNLFNRKNKIEIELDPIIKERMSVKKIDR